MNGERVFAVVVACCCLLAVGATAETVEDVVETSPDEAIDVGQDLLPISQGQLEEISERHASPEGDSGGPESGNTDVSLQEGDGEREMRRVVGVDRIGDVGESDDVREDTGTVGAEDSPTALELLWQWIERLFGWLLAVLPYLIVVAGLVLLARRLADGDWIDARDEGLFDRDDPETRRGPPRPDSEVERLWLEAMARFDLDDEPTKTPAECASAAVEAGADPGAVSLVTEAFERVRYGGAEPTEELRRRARDGVEGLGGSPGGGA